MAYLKLKPIWINEQLKYGLCLFSCSPVKTSGNLRVYFKGERCYKEYSTQFKKWEWGDTEKLSPREREFIMLEIQGMNRQEQADTMIVVKDTISNIKKKIFGKLKMNNRIQAVVYSLNHRLLFISKPFKTKKTSIGKSNYNN